MSLFLLKSCIFVFSMLSSCFAQSIKLNNEEYAVLDKFFRVLVEESEVGYVIQGKKPVCIHGFFKKDPFFLNTLPHQHSVALREGARIWQQLEVSNPLLRLTISQREDPCIPNWIHIIAINPSLFHILLQKNLSLFQYVLGPTITPEKLFSAITSCDVTYHSLFKGDKVLIGEILGFGTQNSLYISRIENLEEILDKVKPPFLKAGSIVKEHPDEFFDFEPGLGFNSIEEELEFLHKKVTFPSQKLMLFTPNFIFGRLKNSKENNKFILDLEKAQKNIQRLLSSPFFLEAILLKFTGHRYQITKRFNNFAFDVDKPTINLIAAKIIVESLSDHDKENILELIKGIENPNIVNCYSDNYNYYQNYLNEFKEIRANLIAADELFFNFEKSNDLVCMIPNKLYYKTIQNGFGTEVCKSRLVSLDFSIYSPTGECISQHDRVLLNLNNTIPGFSIGIQGMKVGETREIFIHPSLGYGYDTSFDKCISLRTSVTLHDFQNSTPYIQSPHYIDLDFILEEKFLMEGIETYKAALNLKGQEIAFHLKKCEQINLSEICILLRDFHHRKIEFAPSTEDEQDLINKIHWNIYFGANLLE